MLANENYHSNVHLLKKHFGCLLHYFQPKWMEGKKQFFIEHKLNEVILSQFIAIWMAIFGHNILLKARKRTKKKKKKLFVDAKIVSFFW